MRQLRMKPALSVPYAKKIFKKFVGVWIVTESINASYDTNRASPFKVNG